jgi:flagellar protein FliS
MTGNVYDKYKNNSVMTASGPELTLMLYNGAIKFCNQAIIAIENNNCEKAHNLIIKVQDIIEEFQSTLDKKYEVAHSFDIMYDYIYNRLIEANINKDVEMLKEILVYLRELRDTWKEAMQIVKQTKQSQAL